MVGLPGRLGGPVRVDVRGGAARRLLADEKTGRLAPARGTGRTSPGARRGGRGPAPTFCTYRVTEEDQPHGRARHRVAEPDARARHAGAGPRAPGPGD